MQACLSLEQHMQVTSWWEDALGLVKRNYAFIQIKVNKRCWSQNVQIKHKILRLWTNSEKFTSIKQVHEIILYTQYVHFLAQDVIYTSRAYATMSVSVSLSVTEVHWRIITNIVFKFQSKFTAHCGEG